MTHDAQLKQWSSLVGATHLRCC